MEAINKIVEQMRKHGMKAPSDKVFINIQDAERITRYYLEQFIGLENKAATWLAEYNQIVDWLKDNEGRGLFLYGNCGRGKTIIAQYVIPAILLEYCRKIVSCYDSQEMNTNLDEVLTRKIICLDDIGVEDMLNTYGNKRLAFLEVIDAAEKHGKLLIVTTNLNQKQLIDKYGERAMDRIMATMKRVLFTGKSLRK